MAALAMIQGFLEGGESKMASKIGVVPVTNPEGGDNRAAQKQDPPISLSQEGSRLSPDGPHVPLNSSGPCLDLMIDERVAALLEERNRLPRFGDEGQATVDGIDRLLGEYTNRKIHSWKLIDEVVKKLTRYEIERREQTRLPFPSPRARR